MGAGAETEAETEVIVIGGSYAGLAAALTLARARRRVLVVDAGERRNRFAASSHGFLTRDGDTPAAIAGIAREQVLAYDTVSWHEGRVEAAAVDGAGFVVTGASGARWRGERLILATGVADRLPEIPGLAARWGRTVFHCPYCHGYELDRRAIAVLATSELALHQALMLPDWGPTTLLLNGAFEPDAAQRAQLDRRGVTVETRRVTGIDGEADVQLADGSRLRFAGLFVAPHTTIAAALVAGLGCAVEHAPHGAWIQVDERRATTVPGVFACGDVARAFGSVTLAVADGAMAAFGAHASLIHARSAVAA